MKKYIMFLLPVLILASEIKKIEYKGLIHISPISANAIINITPNSELNMKKIDEAIKNLYKTGYFQTIKVDYSNGILTFICKEKPTILSVETQNIPQDLKKLLKQNNLLPKKGEIFNEDKIKKLKNFITQYYLAKGYFNTAVEIKTQPVSFYSVKVIIIVNKGHQVIIRKVNFYGAKLPKSELLDEITNQPRTFWSIFPFTNSGKLNLMKLLEDKQKLQDFYYNQGYLDSHVSMPFANTNLDSYFADIDYKIYEGKRYIVKKVTVDYPKNIKVKLPKLKLKPNKYFNVSALRKDIEDIMHAFMDEGYAYAKVYPEIKKEKNYAFVTYKVIPGEIVYIRNVIIQGNNKTLDRVVRRNIYLAPGDKFSYTNYKDSINALKRKGYYDTVKIKKIPVSKNQMDLLVTAKDGLSGTLRAGISYGTYTKLGFNLAITEKDVFGSGQAVSVSANVSAKTATYKLSLFNPRVLDSKYSLNTAIYKSSFDGISYTVKQTGGYIGIGRMLNRFTTANITYGYVDSKLSDYNTTVYVKPKSIKSYVTFDISYNDTDDYFFPTTGTMASFSTQYAGIGGDEKYIKNILKAKYFYPLTDKTYKTYAVLKYRVLAGAIIKNGYLPIDSKFYLGGAGTVRGFSWYSIAPKDSAGNLIGGKYEFVTGPEISTPLNLKSRIWLTGFIDYGAIGENKLNITRSSYGFQIDWITPMGPLSFIWAWPIKSEKGDDLQRFEFSLGASF
ncbi:outer membrane protein assembly factor BamA [Caminibacter sp.]